MNADPICVSSAICSLHQLADSVALLSQADQFEITSQQRDPLQRQIRRII
jgi:hypothetical protein